MGYLDVDGLKEAPAGDSRPRSVVWEGMELTYVPQEENLSFGYV